MFSSAPELIEPISITIKRINKTTTVYSDGVDGMSEDFGVVERFDDIVIQAQVSFDNTGQNPVYQSIGVDEQVKGYLVVLYKDLKNLGIEIKRGDKIVKMGLAPNELNVEYYVLHSNGDPAAHFSAIEGFTLVRIPFGDKVPTE